MTEILFARKDDVDAIAATAAKVAAEAAQAAAELAYDSFDDRYLGAKAADPTLDNDGQALLTGALYFNTALNIMKAYTGAAWVSATASGGVSLFTDLTDTPASYVGHGSKLVRVNAGATALEFVDGTTIFQPLDADLTSWGAVARAAGFDTFAATPSSANLASLISDETGTGALVFATLPTLAGLVNSAALTLSGSIAPAQITADQNDYAPAGFATTFVLHVSSDASRNITGLAGGADGRVIVIENNGTQNIVLKDESASSLAANRFAFSADITLAPDTSVMLHYDSSRWHALALSSGTGDVVGSASSVDSEIALFSGTTGKLLKSATVTGLLKATSGVLAAAVAGTDYYNPGGTDVAEADGGTGSSAFGTASEILAATAAKVLAADDVLSAMASVALTDGANIALDLATGVYFTVTLAGNRTLDNPTNHKVGRTITIKVKQDATGTRTLAYGTQYDFGQDVAPTLSTAANAEDLLVFFVASTTKMVYLGIRKGIE